MFCVSVFVSDLAKSWSSLYREKEVDLILAPEGAGWRAVPASIPIVERVV